MAINGKYQLVIKSVFDYLNNHADKAEKNAAATIFNILYSRLLSITFTHSYSIFRRKQEKILGKIKSRVLSLADKYIEFIFEPFIRELSPLSVLFSSLAGCLFVGWLYTGSVKWGVFSFVYFTFVVMGILSYLILWMFGNKQG